MSKKECKLTGSHILNIVLLIGIGFMIIMTGLHDFRNKEEETIIKEKSTIIDVDSLFESSYQLTYPDSIEADSIIIE